MLILNATNLSMHVKYNLESRYENKLNLLMMCFRVSFSSLIVMVTGDLETIVITSNCMLHCQDADEGHHYQSCDTCAGYVMCSHGYVVLLSSGTVT